MHCRAFWRHYLICKNFEIKKSRIFIIIKIKKKSWSSGKRPNHDFYFSPPCFSCFLFPFVLIFTNKNVFTFLCFTQGIICFSLSGQPLLEWLLALGICISPTGRFGCIYDAGVWISTWFVRSRIFNDLLYIKIEKLSVCLSVCLRGVCRYGNVRTYLPVPTYLHLTGINHMIISTAQRAAHFS